MLTYKMNKETMVLDVKEEIHGWHDTKVSYWYYDTKNWLKSSYGKQGDKPDREMDGASIEWVKTYYLPKVS